MCTNTTSFHSLPQKKNTTKNKMHINHATASHTVEEDESLLPCLALPFSPLFLLFFRPELVVSLLE
jgi:hypothetical protein